MCDDTDWGLGDDRRNICSALQTCLLQVDEPHSHHTFPSCGSLVCGRTRVILKNDQEAANMVIEQMQLQRSQKVLEASPAVESPS